MKYYTIQEVAEELRVGQGAIRGMIKRGNLNAIQLGGPKGAIRIPVSAIDAMMTPIQKAAPKPEPKRREERTLSRHLYVWPREFRMLSAGLQRILRDNEVTIEFMASLTRKEMGRFRGVGEGKLQELDRLLKRNNRKWYGE